MPSPPSVVDRWQGLVKRHCPDLHKDGYAELTAAQLWSFYCDAVLVGRMLDRAGVPMGPKGDDGTD
jgi:hypothetical protein